VSALPFVETYYVNDGGSTDGTRDILDRLADTYSGTINVLSIPDSEYDDEEPWGVIDYQIREMLDTVSTGEWVFHGQADELLALSPGDVPVITQIVQTAEDGEYNSIRQPRLQVHDTDDPTQPLSPAPATVSFDDRYHTVRFVRNVPELTSWEGGDNFQRGDHAGGRAEFTTHDVPPELRVLFPFYHATRHRDRQQHSARHMAGLAPQVNKDRARWRKAADAFDIPVDELTVKDLRQAAHDEYTGTGTGTATTVNKAWEDHVKSAGARIEVDGGKNDSSSVLTRHGAYFASAYELRQAPGWVFDKDQATRVTGIDYTSIS